ncbi:50S ribosomal protein L19e [Halobacteriales archaeon QH_10_67_22]|nr:MAG: 50S ribosomal protein L19e [Halobacteriales archaeon QH_10_67_22]
MTDLTAQKRMAAEVLDVGDIRAEEPKGNSRGRARERQEKRAYGHRKGQGSRKGTAGGRENEKDKWASSIRAQRTKLRELRDDGTITRSRYRELYDKASGGEFDSVADIERTIEGEN